MADEDGDNMDVLNDLMSVRSGRYLLSSKVRRVLVPCLVETLDLTSLEDVESPGAKGFEQALAAAGTKDEVPESLKSGALEWYASLSAPSRLRPAARFAAKEKTPDKYGSSRKQKTVQEAREDSDADDDVESVAHRRAMVCCGKGCTHQYTPGSCPSGVGSTATYHAGVCASGSGYPSMR